MYGFGIHSNREGKIALYGMETEAYQRNYFNQRREVVKHQKASCNFFVVTKMCRSLKIKHNLTYPLTTFLFFLMC